MPQISCINSSVKFDFNVTAVIPDGILTASYDDSTVKYNWQYKFNSPIVNIWKWNGQYIKLVDLFNANIKREVVPTINKGIYLGMHNKQVCIKYKMLLNIAQYLYVLHYTYILHTM